MKKILYFLLLLVITNNFFIFVFGLVYSAKAANYEKVQQDNYILDSALTLAVQAREDGRHMPHLEAEFSMKGKTAGYEVRKLDEGSDYVKVFIKMNTEILFREYLLPHGSQPVIIPKVEPKPAMTASPTPVEAAEGPEPTATITPVVAPVFYPIK